MRPRIVAFWCLLAVTIGVYATMLVWTLPAISAAAGGLTPFDMQPGGYDLPAAQGFLAALTEDGRALYLGAQHRLDAAYPALLAATLIWSLAWAFRWAPAWARIALAIPPVIGAAADYLENARVSGLLLAEAVTADQVAAASQATIVKSSATTVAMLCLLAGLGLVAIRRLLGRRAGGQA